jgi:hypothetical protein
MKQSKIHHYLFGNTAPYFANRTSLHASIPWLENSVKLCSVTKQARGTNVSAGIVEANFANEICSAFP